VPFAHPVHPMEPCASCVSLCSLSAVSSFLRGISGRGIARYALVIHRKGAGAEQFAPPPTHCRAAVAGIVGSANRAHADSFTAWIFRSKTQGAGEATFCGFFVSFPRGYVVQTPREWGGESALSLPLELGYLDQRKLH